MENKELEQQYLQQASEYLATIIGIEIPEHYAAVFIAGVEKGLSLREQELS